MPGYCGMDIYERIESSFVPCCKEGACKYTSALTLGDPLTGGVLTLLSFS